MPSEIVIHLFPVLLATCASAAFLDSFVQPAAPKPEYIAEPVSLLSLNQQTVKIVEPNGVIAGDSQSYASLWFYAHALLLWQFFGSLSLTGLVKVLCVTGNVLVQVSPFPQVKRWESRGDTGGADSAPYVSIAFGGWQWCFYGVFAWLVTGRTGFLILLQSNSLGALLGSYYTYAFYRQCQSEQARSYLLRYLSFVAGLALFEACTTAVLPAQRALFLVGLVSAFCGFVGALSVLVTVPTVLRARDSKSIPGPVVAAGCVTSLLWTLCGLMLGDQLIALPSIAGLGANTVCVALKLLYPASEECEAPSEDLAASLPQASPYRVTPTLRAQLRDRMEQRWRQALNLKPTECTPLMKKGWPRCADEAGPGKHEKEAMEAELGRAPEAVHEDTGGTR